MRDPRFNCKVFHFCHEDGTRVTIPCSQSSSKHRVCLFKDIISNACEDSEIYLALPEDQSQIKSSKDTTASAFNDATEFKLPRVLSQPSSSTKKQSTTPLSFGEHKNEKTNSLLTQGVDGIYEVFNSVLKEIESEEKSQLDNSDSSEDALDLPFAPAIVPADTPTIPITIETRRKKKSKSKKKPKQSPDPAVTVSADPLQGTRNENPEILVPVRSSQRPPRTRGRPSHPSEQPASRRPERQRDRVRLNQSDEQQAAKNPAERKPPNRGPHISEQNQAPRRPQNDAPYIPTELVLQPEIGQNLPLRNVISNEYVPNIPSHPYALPYDLAYQNQPISENVQNRPLEIVYSQREPNQRLRPQLSTQSERERRPTEPQVYSTHNYSPTTFSPPSQRTRNPDRYPPRTTHTSRPRPTEEPTRSIDERPVYRYRSTPAPREGSSYIRTRPSSTRQQYHEESPVTTRYYENSSPRYRPSASSDDSPNQVHSRYPEQVQRPRSRPHAQIERPPSEYTDVQPVAERPTYSRPQDSFSYPPQGDLNYNDVNVISTIGDSGERFDTQRPAVRRPGYRGTASNSRRPYQNSDSEVQNGFLPLTEAPVRENSYPSRETVSDQRDSEYERPRSGKPYRNRYQDFDDEITTREVTTTARPTTKRRPPPPRPTFPAFPTFPPPPKRPVTSPKPRTTSESPELKEEVKEFHGHSVESDITSKSTEGRAPYVETYNSPEISKSKELITEKSLYTEEPEVTTRRRTRKRRPKPRRPKPSTAAPDDDPSYIDLSTSAPTEKETSTKSASERYNVRKVTPQPRRTTSTTTAAEIHASASSVKNEEYGSRINLFGKPRTRKPAVFQNKFTTTTATPSKQEPQRYTKVTTSTRTRRPYTRRTRPKSTTTTTEPSDVTESFARHDEEADSSNLSWRDATEMVPLQESESITQISVDAVPDDIQSTEPYNELVETTEVPDITTVKTFDENESSTESKEKVENFESTRSVQKKFQNRPRVLKFGKPKLRTTEPPLDLNVAASIRRV
ncbi:mucin-5AC-like [Uloborus diversus]|uniref:mucin-5AC-like n=1 Tax=Uloborus diversus TaxID=327109 RepID=UPI0024093C59|nr:mucin-5AC-like [Uloborus diversus]